MHIKVIVNRRGVITVATIHTPPSVQLQLSLHDQTSLVMIATVKGLNGKGLIVKGLDGSGFAMFAMHDKACGAAKAMVKMTRGEKKTSCKSLL